MHIELRIEIFSSPKFGENLSTRYSVVSEEAHFYRSP